MHILNTISSSKLFTIVVQTYDIFCAAVETMSVTCSEQQQQEAFDVALMLFT